jgi:chromosome segregation protein
VLQGPPLPPALVEAQTATARLWEDARFDEVESRRITQVLQAKLDRLGHVNLDAVRELDETESSYHFLEQEVADLKEARKSLMETLRRLETESRSLFETTFEAARKNFQAIFRKLFQGGRADMQLVGVDDSLEAGIEITAKPPGKELQSINLLSGGERSLTALAILFAVFQVKPSPFCILDEVDAALDETNVERFLRVLRDFVGPTQFCIVTHHKRTMAECQQLYGITMQRRGVSSRIAVSLDEVDRVTGDTEGTGPGRLRAAAPAAPRLRSAADVN